ncbi:DegT/DnrJ/EryC1/StrS family aminotransferase [soil metagenome]
MEPIQMVDLQKQYLKIKDEIDQAIHGVIDQSLFINGPAVKDFAKDLASYQQVKHVIPCANGTDALQIALMAMEYPSEAEIIVPAFTYVATVEVIALLGLKPVFVDVNPDNFNIDVLQVREKISERTVAIIPVHLYGQCAQMEKLLEISEKYNLHIIEDAAQALGSENYFSNGNIRKAGTMGIIGATSFFPSKNLGCFGDGGALFTNNDELAPKLQMIANHGQKKKYHHSIIGVNSRLDTLQAAILRVKLKYLDEYNNKRNELAKLYDQAFETNNLITIPKRSKFSNHVFHQYTLILNDINREKFKDYLQEKGIPTMVYYPIPLHLQEAYVGYGYKIGQFPVAESLCQSVISLPIHTEMDISQAYYIIESVNNYLK